jgi:adenylate cyclase
MGVEIERKFLVKDDSWRGAVMDWFPIVQGYLATTEQVTLRVRIQGTRACVTIKGPMRGISRSEYEYPIPVMDARAMLAELAVLPVIDKVRYRVRWGAHVWDLDLFGGDNAGLALAEIELERPDEPFERPPWAGLEVTGDPRYSNANLARRPFSRW